MRITPNDWFIVQYVDPESDPESALEFGSRSDPEPGEGTEIRWNKWHKLVQEELTRQALDKEALDKDKKALVQKICIGLGVATVGTLSYIVYRKTKWQ